MFVNIWFLEGLLLSTLFSCTTFAAAWYLVEMERTSIIATYCLFSACFWNCSVDIKSGLDT